MPGLCDHCHIQPITGRKRKYCVEHSRLASTLWKRLHRRLWKVAGDKYWLSDWKNKTPEERKAYFRSYMREYRRGKRLATQTKGRAGDVSSSPSSIQTTDREQSSLPKSPSNFLRQVTASKPLAQYLSATQNTFRAKPNVGVS